MACKPNKLKDELTCSVCCETYDDTDRKMPTMLLCCQKVFCQQCVSTVQTCPNCRKVVTSAGQRPCRILLSILECLCSVCHRREKDKSCPHCSLSVCISCYSEHLLVHDEDVAKKQEELTLVLETAQSFIDELKNGLEEFRSEVIKRRIALTDSEGDSLKNATLRQDASAEADVPEAFQSVERRYLDKIASQRRAQDHVAKYIIPVLVIMARELSVSVPTSLIDFNRKPLFEKVTPVSNVDLPIPADAIAFINALSLNRVLSQIANQPCVDRRHLVSNSTPIFQLMQEENATRCLVYNNFVLLATTRARVLILRDECLEFVIPSITYGNAISGLTVARAVDGTEVILAVDGSDKVYRHPLRSSERQWDVFFVGQGDVGFSDIVVHDSCVYVASQARIHVVSVSQEMELSTVMLTGNEQNPSQIIVVDDDKVLLKKDENRSILMKSMIGEFETKTLDFNFNIRDMRLEKERRQLSLIGYHDASDQFALHTFDV